MRRYPPASTSFTLPRFYLYQAMLRAEAPQLATATPLPDNAVDNAIGKLDAAFEQGDYTASLQALAALKTPVDAFFDGVMVNAEDPALRQNRLALLASLHRAMNRVADLSKLAS